MADDIKMRFAGDSADAERAIAQLERKYEGLENRIKRLTQEMKDKRREGVQGFDALAQGAQRFGTALTGIGGPLDAVLQAINLAKTEWDDLIRRQEKSRDENVKYAHAVESMAINIFGDKTLTLPAAKRHVEQISARTGVAPSVVAEAIGTGASARGHLPAGDVPPAVEAVLRTIPQLVESHALLTGVVLDVRKDVPKASPGDVIGFAQAMMSQSRVTTMRDLAQHAMPGVVGLAKLEGGANYRDNAALMASLTQASNDFSGRTSRTAGVALALQLREFLKGNAELDTTAKRIAFMQQTPEARNAFLYGGEFQGKRGAGLQMNVTGEGGEQFQIGTDRASFERKMFPAIEAILTQGSQAAKNLESARRAIPELLGASVANEEFIAGKNADPTIMFAEREMKMQQASTRGRLRDLRGASRASIRSAMDEALQTAGYGYIQRSIRSVDFDLGTGLEGRDPAEFAARQLGTARDFLSPSDSSGRQVLQDMIDALRGIQHNTAPKPGLNGQKEPGANE